MSEYFENGYIETGYADVASSGSDVPVSNFDLSSVLSELQRLSTSVDSLISSASSHSTFLARIDGVDDNLLTQNYVILNKDVDLLNSLNELKTSLHAVNLSSLNGAGCEFKDGTSVTVSGRSTIYIVERSFMSLFSDNGYTVHYDLLSSDGYRCTVPEALLLKYIPPVV